MYVCKFDQVKGKVTAPLVCGAVLPEPSYLEATPDERFLYASNRLKGDGIAIFRISEYGSLTKTAYVETGRHPRNIAITLNGKYLLASCKDSGCIQIFKRNKKTGGLKRMPENIVLDSPVCVIFSK